MKISCITQNFSTWGGGVDFIKFLVNSISLADPGQNVKKQLILPIWEQNLSVGEDYFRKYFADAAVGFELTFVSADYGSQIAAARAFGADVILPCLHCPPHGYDGPWVGYLYDFQHKHYPNLFSAHERQVRDVEFAEMLSRAKHAITHARDVISDADRFYAGYSAQLHALPFSPCPLPGWLENSEDVSEKYEIDKPYFIINNQFWVHKDHPTAFNAFSLFLNSGEDGLLICTGNTSDYRFPNYFIQIQNMLIALEISDRVKVLGYIPKSDQIQLVKGALAVVQPTRFEGGPGGGAAFDAIAVGVPVIASNIPVNCEMDSGDLTFFTAGDPHSLASAMVARRHRSSIRPSSEQLWNEGLPRRRRCGQTILDIARLAINT